MATSGQDSNHPVPTKLPGPHIEAVSDLCRFMKQNKKLLHVDLSYMAMDAEALAMFGRTLRRSRSLVGLHLTGNPGNTADLQMLLDNQVHCKPYDPPTQSEFRKIVETERRGDKSRRHSLEDSLNPSDGEGNLGDALVMKRAL